MINEPYVNHVLMQRVLDIKARSENNKMLEVIGITDLWNKAMAMDDEELVTFALAALYKCPNLVFAALAQDREELLRKGKKNDRDNH